MTMVNWERLGGDEVERFVAAVILLTNPTGNRITPSRGDRGVDIRVDTTDGTDIYQVKRYAGPLTSRQQSDIKASWDRFVTHILPTTRIRSWTLVCPWDPTNERREWLHELTAGHDFTNGWMGRTQLDVLAADHPNLVDYYFGDGNRRTQELMAQALNGQPLAAPSDLERPVLLEALIEQAQNNTNLLSEVDPFYSYELEVRHGALDTRPSEIPDPRLASAHYRPLSDTQYMVLRLYPKSAESHWLRPIGFELQMHAAPGTAEHAAIEAFRQFGAPVHNVEGTVLEATGPPGASMRLGRAIFSLIPVASEATTIPDLELRTRDADGRIVSRTELVNIGTTTGLDGQGIGITGTDRSGYLSIELRLANPEAREMFRLSASTIGGLNPRDVLPTADFLSTISSEVMTEVGFHDDGPTISTWNLAESSATFLPYAAELALACQNLIALQKHCLTRIKLPHTMNDDFFEQLQKATQVIAGQTVSGTWQPMVLPHHPEQEPEWLHSNNVDLQWDQLLTLTTPDADLIQTTVRIRTEAKSATIIAISQPGDEQPKLRAQPADSPHCTITKIEHSDPSWALGRLQATIPA